MGTENSINNSETDGSVSRRYPSAPVCAVGALIYRGSRILLVRRGKAPSLGKWSVPGGRLRLGETLEAAVVRETREETCLVVRPLKIGKVVEHLLRDEQGDIEYHYVIVDYVCRIIGGSPRPASDVSEVRFVEISELSQWDMTEGTAQVIQEVFERTIQTDETSNPLNSLVRNAGQASGSGMLGEGNASAAFWRVA